MARARARARAKAKAFRVYGFGPKEFKV